MFDQTINHFRKADSLVCVEKVEEIMKKLEIIKSYSQTEPTNYLRDISSFSLIRKKKNQYQEKWQKFYDIMSSKTCNNFGIDIQEILNSNLDQHDSAKVLKMDCGSGYDKYLKIYMNEKWEFQFTSYRMASPIRYEVQVIDQISGEIYDFSKPNINTETLNKWLDYLINCCENEGIKVKV